MISTVLIENAISLVVVGAAYHKARKIVVLTVIMALMCHMGFDYYLLADLRPAESIKDNQMYYMLSSLFFLAMFGLFISNATRLSIIMAGFMITQSILCFLMSINGGAFDGVHLPEYEIIYQVHSWFNNLIWIAECVVVYASVFTSRE